MTVRRSILRLLAPLAFVAAPTVVGAAAAPPAKPADPAGVEFFEKKVRPVLAQHCYSCHSDASQKLKGNLHLDSRAGALKGGDNGPAVVPGQPDKSPLVKAIGWTDDSKMPPKAQIPAQAVADLTAWVQMGAPWPAERKSGGIASAGATNKPVGQVERYAEQARTHWAWQPVKAVARLP